jgi:NAD(P)-dependent dehydrogenase (short-subunit alcohol dehydrogenase family)
MIIFITGANRGIGLYQTKCFLKDGDTVFATYRSEENTQELKELKENFPKHLHLIKGDVTCDDDVKRFYPSVLKHTEHIDMLINNAGTDLETQEPGLIEDPIDVFSKTYDINTVSMVRVIKNLLPLLEYNTKPSIIVNTSSGIGSMTNEITMTRYAYMMSKAAVNMLSRVMAYEFKDKNIITIAWSPGWVKTRLGTEKATLTLDEAGAMNVRVLKSITPYHNGKWVDVSGEVWEF